MFAQYINEQKALKLIHFAANNGKRRRLKNVALKSSSIIKNCPLQ